LDCWEQVFFHDKGLKNEPKACKPCKQAKNERLAAIAALNLQEFDNVSRFRFFVRNVDNKRQCRFIHLKDARLLPFVLSGRATPDGDDSS
jgi:hypothetical protein